MGAWKASRPGSGGPGGLGCVSEQAGKARKPGASEGEDAWHGKPLRGLRCEQDWRAGAGGEVWEVRRPGSLVAWRERFRRPGPEA